MYIGSVVQTVAVIQEPHIDWTLAIFAELKVGVA
jgi:hypothetical protein